MLPRQTQTSKKKFVYNEFFENDKVRQKSLIAFDFKSNIEIISGNVIDVLFILYIVACDTGAVFSSDVLYTCM